jgi:tRNA (cmo5U34)-methyltransferase
MSKVGDGIDSSSSNWNFGGEVPKFFDAHVSKSVPLYNEGHDLICNMSDFFVKQDSVVYEIGCSTGSLSFKLASHNFDKRSAQFIGVDIEPNMIEVANEKALEHDDKNLNISFIVGDVLDMDIEPTDMIVCYYTIQFIHPSIRQQLITKFYNSLNWGGALFMFEKVRGSDARFQDILTAAYIDYKLKNNYTSEEIISKSRSLRGILEPFSTLGNIDLMKRAGFVDINTIQKFMCFEGFLAIK